MFKNIIITIFVSLLLILPKTNADVGIGITYFQESLTLGEFEENCVTYKIYNPFNSDVTAKISVAGDIEPLMTTIEPNNFLLKAYDGSPDDNNQKLKNNKETKVCFKSKIFRWPPFYPQKLEGVILAGAMPGGISGSGSSTVSSVQAPLFLRVGSMKTFKTFIFTTGLLIIIMVFFLLKLLKKIPKIKKMYCKKCDKYFIKKNKFCPKCGGELKETN